MSATRCSWPQVNLILCKNTFLSTMAKIIYEVKKNQNSHSAAFGKWYAQIKNLETLNTRKLANHISEHGSIYTPDVVYGVEDRGPRHVLLHAREPEEGCAEEGGLQPQQAPEGAPHPIPARAGSRGEHFFKGVPQAGRVHQHRLAPAEQGGGGERFLGKLRTRRRQHWRFRHWRLNGWRHRR